MIEGINWSKPSESQSSGHPDAKRNYSYAKEQISRQEKLLRNISVVFDGINKNHEGNFSENVSVSFYWKAKAINYGFPLSFHQPRNNFKSDLDGFFASVPKRIIDLKPDSKKQIDDAEWLDFKRKDAS